MSTKEDAVINTLSGRQRWPESPSEEAIEERIVEILKKPFPFEVIERRESPGEHGAGHTRHAY